jgi:hypothetical protein
VEPEGCELDEDGADGMDRQIQDDRCRELPVAEAIISVKIYPDYKFSLSVSLQWVGRWSPAPCLMETGGSLRWWGTGINKIRE